MRRSKYIEQTCMGTHIGAKNEILQICAPKQDLSKKTKKTHKKANIFRNACVLPFFKHFLVKAEQNRCNKHVRELALVQYLKFCKFVHLSSKNWQKKTKKHIKNDNVIYNSFLFSIFYLNTLK